MVSSPASPPIRPQDVHIIHEIYDHYNTIGHEQSLQQLDLALEANAPIIIIEPIRLGDETSRWIAVGNFLHKSTVLAGIGATATCGLFPNRWLIYAPQAILSIGCFAVYTISWQSDPCCKYQVRPSALLLMFVLFLKDFYFIIFMR